MISISETGLLPVSSLNHILRLHTEVVVVADNEVVEDFDAEEFTGFDKLFGELYIISGGFGVARGVVRRCRGHNQTKLFPFTISV